ncbi:hypothetical protein E4U59_003093 [Claviceps monticola]|nr:hypothetical protein E4U59_003093 [Claviceps monticola]
MASSPEAPTAARRQWEKLDSDDIASVMSEDLYENRPNRWTGPRSTWRTQVREERMLWRSRQQVVDQDLAVHLYNAFALKRRDLNAKTAQGLTMKLGNGQEAIWAPPKVWTAWPLQERQVPPEGLFKKADDEAEAFTLRRQEKKLPSSELQEELGATILRMAKERFRRRQQQRQQQRQQRQQEREQRQRERLRRQQQMSRSSSIAPSIETPSRPVSLKFEESEDGTFPSSLPPGRIESSDDDDKVKLSWTSDDEYNDDDADGGQEGNEGSQPDPESPTQDYEPAVATDDQLSQQFLRPSIRHILTQLDRTLTVLHNSRVAGQIHIFDSSDSSMEDDSDAAPARGRGRPRRMPQPGSRDIPPATAAAEAAAAAAAKAATYPQRRRGRPPKVRVPLEGETMEEMQFRLARQSHRRLPVTEKDEEAAFLAWLEEGDQQMMREAQTQNQESPPPPPPPPGEQELVSPSSSHGGASPPSQPGNMQRRLRKWGLRDWSDVLGAASLAGFSPDVIARSTRRCASLFNQGMLMRTLNEQPLSRGPGLTITEFRPKPVATKIRGRAQGQGLGNSVSPSSSAAALFSTDSDSDGDIDSESDMSHETLRSRKHIFSLSSVPLDSSPIRSRGRSRTRRSPSNSAASNAHSQSRSRSRSSAGLFLCAVPTCSRAVGGFARRLNLRRHMQLVHPGYAEEEDDSENEVVGAVHVDGFLKMIHPGKGWRAEDMLPRKRKRYYGRGSSRDR